VYRSDSTGVAAQFVSLLVPTSGAKPSITRTTVAGADAYSVAIEGDARRLVYVDNPDAKKLIAGDSAAGAVTVNATAFLVGFDSSGGLAFGSFANYTTLQAGALNLGGSASPKRKAAVVDFFPVKAVSRFTEDNLNFTDLEVVYPIVVPPDAGPGPDADAGNGPDSDASSTRLESDAASGGSGCAAPGTSTSAPHFGLMVIALLCARRRRSRAPHGWL
jgi:hypothetical protein